MFRGWRLQHEASLLATQVTGHIVCVTLAACITCFVWKQLVVFLRSNYH